MTRHNGHVTVFVLLAVVFLLGQIARTAGWRRGRKP